MDILVSRTLYMSCQAGPGIEPGPSAPKASALPIELTWQTNLLVMDDTLYFFVNNKHIYTVDPYWCMVGFLNSSLRHNGVDTSITLDSAKWNCDGAELSSSVITLFY